MTPHPFTLHIHPQSLRNHSVTLLICVWPAIPNSKVTVEDLEITRRYHVKPKQHSIHGPQIVANIAARHVSVDGTT